MSARLTGDSTESAWSSFSAQKHHLTACVTAARSRDGSFCFLSLCSSEEVCSFQREIEVLSEQYSQKCLENAHLAQALEAERQALRQCQRENQELNAHNQVHINLSHT